MIKEQFVPYEMCVKLKILGMELRSFFGRYNVNNRKLLNPKSEIFTKGTVIAPLWQQAFDWFREDHELLSYIYKPFNDQYCFEIHNLKENPQEGELSEMQSKVYDDYNECKLNCLETLIDIIKENKTNCTNLIKDDSKTNK